MSKQMYGQRRVRVRRNASSFKHPTTIGAVTFVYCTLLMLHFQFRHDGATKVGFM